MAKAIRWQIPFVSTIDKNKYRIDIYDEEGGWSGITTLYGGSSPLVTNEDDNVDFFAPIRIQTGNIQVCTDLPGGGRIKLEDLLPSNNISRYVRLIRMNENTSEDVVWQGFLSCEAYNQEYISTPQMLSIPVISTLEAMGSVEIDTDKHLGFGKIIAHIVKALSTLEEKCGLSLFENITIPKWMDDAIIFTYIYDNIYFQSDEVVSGENIIVETRSLSCKTILERISKFYGLVWRESGQNIILDMQDSVETPALTINFGTAKYFYLVVNTDVSWNEGSILLSDMEDLQWRGINHQQDVLQGKKRVKISSKLEDFSCNIDLRECPVGSLVENPEERQARYGEVYCNTNETFYSLAHHQHIQATATFASDGVSGATLSFDNYIPSIGYADTIFWRDNEFRTYYEELVYPPRTKAGTIPVTLTSYMCWWRNQVGDLVSGLMLCGIPKNLIYQTNPITGYLWNKFELTDSNYIFKQDSALFIAASEGFFRLKLQIAPVVWNGYGLPQYRDNDGVYSAGWYLGYTPSLTIAIQVGSMWVKKDNGVYSLQDTFTTFDLELEYDGSVKSNWDDSYKELLGINEESGLYIPIESQCDGRVSIYFYHEIDGVVNGYQWTGAFDIIIQSFALEYLPLDRELLSDRRENGYMADTGSAFRDVLDVNLDMASYARNSKLATMIWSSAPTPKSLVFFNGKSVRPELYLLERMKRYYKSARQNLTLIVKHPELSTTSQMLRMNGINDGKTYIPIAESRNWKDDISTITCMEIPNE